jgi:hypothetical protein
MNTLTQVIDRKPLAVARFKDERGDTFARCRCGILHNLRFMADPITRRHLVEGGCR